MYDLLLRAAIKLTFPLWQALGVHITRNHFYDPVPDTRRLRDDLWLRKSDLTGIDRNDDEQLHLLDLFSTRFKPEYDQFPRNRTSRPHEFYLNNGNFLSVDAEVLYCMIRAFKPNRIVEIGSGYSTCLSARAVKKNQEVDPGYAAELITIDPFPHPVVRDGIPGVTRIIQKNVQDIPLAFFRELTNHDILFIDSSHMLRIGSDVQYEYLEILPSLQKGVLIHVHDIFFPYEYPKEWAIHKYRFWNEQYLLQAFLAFNHSFEIIWAGSYLHSRYPDRLAAAFGSYRTDERWDGRVWRPSSFWMRRTG